jgi:hypothetical protein
VTILSAADITPEERAAIADEPRPGVWVQDDTAYAGDGRALDQHETDRLIVSELHRNPAGYGDQGEPVRAVGFPLVVMLGSSRQPGYEQALEQRGGIHSDPLVRLLAFRAWGDRDRVWQFDEVERIADQLRTAASAMGVSLQTVATSLGQLAAGAQLTGAAFEAINQIQDEARTERRVRDETADRLRAYLNNPLGTIALSRR